MTLRRSLARLGAAFLLAAPAASADRVEVPNTVDVPSYVTPCEDGDRRGELGTVAAVTGAASRAAPGCTPAPLACDAPVRDGDRIATTESGTLAFRAGAAWVQLAGGSAAVLRRDADGALVLALETGSARVMRLEPGAMPRLEAPGLAAVAAGDDVAAQVGAGGSQLCSWAEPLDVRNAASGRIARAATGECVGSGAARAASLDVSVADVGLCAVAVGPLNPYDVATGPPPAPPALPPPVLPPVVCTNGSCSGGPGKIPVVEQPGGYEPPP